jgi:hypothetical protein
MKFPTRPLLAALVATLAAALVAGCASRSVDVRPLPSDPGAFAAWPCDAIDDETERVQQRAADVAYAVDTRAGNNLIALSVGTALFWPALFAMRPDGPDAQELAALKGRHDALRAAARAKDCPAADTLPPARAAALPIAPGDRLVYEERRAGGMQILGLTVVALRRGETEFLYDRGPGSVPQRWRQDAAGNVQVAPQLNVVSWTRLLRRDLRLGDALAGALRVPALGPHDARVRAQVIAIGPQQLDGRSFDAATLELFGELPGGDEHAAQDNRFEGVMVVDRASGVLLRLELSSAQPELALRRRLMRIEPPASLRALRP